MRNNPYDMFEYVEDDVDAVQVMIFAEAFLNSMIVFLCEHDKKKPSINKWEKEREEKTGERGGEGRGRGRGGAGEGGRRRKTKGHQPTNLLVMNCMMEHDFPTPSIPSMTIL